MSADDSREELFVYLRILARITPNDRIITNSSDVRIDDEGWSGMQWWRRFWGGEKRDINIARAKRVFGAMTLHVSSAVELNEAWTLLAATSRSHAESARHKIADSHAFIQRALDAMSSAADGVDNLRKTYAMYGTIVARIEELCDTVRTFVATTRRRVGLADNAVSTPVVADAQSAHSAPSAPSHRPTVIQPRGGHPMFDEEDPDT